MKVLLVTHHWHTNSHHSRSSGYSRIAYYLSHFHEIHVLTWGEANRVQKENNFSVIFKKVPSTNFLFEKRLALSFWAAKIANNYDLVHSIHSDTGLIVALKSPTIITEHSLSEIDPSLWMKYKSIIQRPALRKAKLVITVSRSLKEIIRKKYNKRVVFIPHGVDIHSFRPQKCNQNKKDALLRGTYLYLAFSCGIQGVDSQIFQNVASRFPEILFVVVGRRERVNKIKNIYHPGKISEDQLKEFYAMSDFCFKPLKFATANNAILEAMAMGKVNITNKIPGITDYLTDEYAYLAKTNEDFVNLFKKAMENKKEREYKGQEARKRVEKYFSWEVIALRTKEIYKKVLKEK